MSSFNIKNLLLKSSEIIFDKKSLIKNGIYEIAKCIKFANNPECLMQSYTGNKIAFTQQVLIYATIQFPSILKFIGYNISKKNQYIFLEMKKNGTLENCIAKKEKLSSTNKLIISYGIARALKYLHEHKIVHRNIKLLNIYLDSNFYPYLSDFYMSKHIDMKIPYILKRTTIEYMAPEFIKNFVSNQDSFKLDVYSFSVLLYYLITEKKPHEAILIG